MGTQPISGSLNKRLEIVVLVSLFAMPALAATETVLHAFVGRDGSKPFAGLTLHGGSLYGTTTGGGSHSQGTVFKLTPSSGAWKETVLYSFAGGSDGNDPQAGVIFDKAGNLFGTTHDGGTGNCALSCGTVFELTPVNGSWSKKILYNFGGGADGGSPSSGLIFDQAGSLYGTTSYGGIGTGGVVFKLTPSGNQWIETVLYQFAGKPDGAGPDGGVIFDKAGNLYGTTAAGGTFTACNSFGGGTAFKLSPNPDGTWSETVLHSFGGGTDGCMPLASLVLDSAGDLYGTTIYGGSAPFGGNGTVFQLTPSNGSWTETVIHDFTGASLGKNPQSALIRDQAGNLYGTASGGAHFNGIIFKLAFSNGTWTTSEVYSFQNSSEGTHPSASVIMDKAGNFYGTTVSGGGGGGVNGVVYRVQP